MVVYKIGRPRGLFVHPPPLVFTHATAAPQTPPPSTLASPSQVDVAFDDEHTAGTRTKRTAAFEIVDITSECLPIAERQTAWLERSASQAAPATWRLVQHYRLGGKHWRQALDNQFLHSAMCVGLSFFRFGRERKGLWSSWRSFPLPRSLHGLGAQGVVRVRT